MTTAIAVQVHDRPKSSRSLQQAGGRRRVTGLCARRRERAGRGGGGTRGEGSQAEGDNFSDLYVLYPGGSTVDDSDAEAAVRAGCRPC